MPLPPEITVGGLVVGTGAGTDGESDPALPLDEAALPDELEPDEVEPELPALDAEEGEVVRPGSSWATTPTTTPTAATAAAVVHRKARCTRRIAVRRGSSP